MPVKKDVITLSAATLKRLKESEKPKQPVMKIKNVERRTVKEIVKKISSEKTPSTDEPSKESKKVEVGPHAGNRYKNQYSDIKRALSARAAKEVRERKEKEQLKKVERETRELEIKQMIEQARQKTK